MSSSVTGFTGFQTSLIGFSGAALAIKFLDIRNFGLLVIGPDSDKNLAVGIVAIIALLYTFISLVITIINAINTYISDTTQSSPSIPSFGEVDGSLNSTLVLIKFTLNRILYFFINIFPILFGVFTTIMTHLEIIYFFQSIPRMLGVGVADAPV